MHSCICTTLATYLTSMSISRNADNQNIEQHDRSQSVNMKKLRLLSLQSCQSLTYTCNASTHIRDKSNSNMLMPCKKKQTVENKFHFQKQPTPLKTTLQRNCFPRPHLRTLDLFHHQTCKPWRKWRLPTGYIQSHLLRFGILDPQSFTS